MIATVLPYVFSLAAVAALLVLAGRNRRQGWRRHRDLAEALAHRDALRRGFAPAACRPDPCDAEAATRQLLALSRSLGQTAAPPLPPPETHTRPEAHPHPV